VTDGFGSQGRASWEGGGGMRLEALARVGSGVGAALTLDELTIETNELPRKITRFVSINLLFDFAFCWRSLAAVINRSFESGRKS